MMHLFLVGLSLLMISFIVHLIIWRVHIPTRPMLALLGIFALTPVLVVSIYAASNTLAEPAEISLSGAVRVLLFYLSCSLAYISLYSAIEVQSPTLAIVAHVASCGSVGCSEAELAEAMPESGSVIERIRLMEVGRLISISEGQCKLTPEGRLWAGLFEYASKFFGLPLGG